MSTCDASAVVPFVSVYVKLGAGIVYSPTLLRFIASC